MRNIYIYGAGAFGTALAYTLSKNKENKIFITDANSEIVEEIKEKGRNSFHFPNFSLENINTFDKSIEKLDGLILLAIPSKGIGSWVEENANKITESSLIINLSKGFDQNGELIYKILQNNFQKNEVMSVKGPSFADELIRGFPSLLTVAAQSENVYQELKNAFEDTNVVLEYSDDFEGVELLSILKNVYSIFMGIIDARYNSANTTFLAFTKSFEEIKKLYLRLGGKEQTLIKGAGIGDFGLTSLNDLSRNRTFGLFVGKGFYNAENKHSVLVEGLRSIELMHGKVNDDIENYKILDFLYRLFFNGEDIKGINKLLQKL